MEMMSGFVNLLGLRHARVSRAQNQKLQQTPLPLGGHAPSNLISRGVVISGVVAAYTLHPTLFPFYENQYVI